MAIKFDTATIQPVTTPAAAVASRQPIVSPIGEREGASNDRRGDARNTRDRVNVAFRSFLAAATLAGLTDAVSDVRADTRVEETVPVREARIPDAKKNLTILDADEAEGLYRSAHAADVATDEAPRSTRAREFHAAATHYAKSYFSVEGTFARPGESLELSA